LLELACIAKSTDEAVVRIDLSLAFLRASYDGGAKGFDGFSG
jgi:hypothetical protein